MKISTAVLVTLIGLLGLSACKSDRNKGSKPWDDDMSMAVPEYGCPFYPEEPRDLDSLIKAVEEEQAKYEHIEDSLRESRQAADKITDTERHE